MVSFFFLVRLADVFSTTAFNRGLCPLFTSSLSGTSMLRVARICGRVGYYIKKKKGPGSSTIAFGGLDGVITKRISRLFSYVMRDGIGMLDRRLTLICLD